MTLPLASEWFSVTEAEPGLFVITEPHCHRLIRSNCFLIIGRDRDILVDSGMGFGRLKPLVTGLSRNPLLVFTTHTHSDHVGSHGEFPEAEIVVHALEADDLRRPGAQGLRFPYRPPEQIDALRKAGIELSEFMVDALPYANFDCEGHHRPAIEPSRLVDEGDVIDIGAHRFEILHVPGHSPGSIALWEARLGLLFSGDALYDGVLVDTGPGADVTAYFATMRRLAELPVLRVYGGHKLPMDGDRMRDVIAGYLASKAGITQ